MEIMTIPILCGELPKFIGAICYEGDKNVKRLEFTGAEPGLQYKLDMERTDGAKNVVDLKNQNGTLVLNMDGSVRIPAGRYQVQLRTIGDTVKHTNKAFLTVRDSIDAVNAFASGMPTEMEQMEQRLTDAMHRSEKAATEAEGAVVNAEKAATEAKTAAESVNSEVFIAEYGVTSLGEIGKAWNAGKVIFCNYNNKYRVPLYAKTDSMAVFYAVSNDSGVYLKRTKSAWSNSTIRHPVAHTHTMDDVVLTEADKKKIKEELKKYIYEEILGT